METDGPPPEPARVPVRPYALGEVLCAGLPPVFPPRPR